MSTETPESIAQQQQVPTLTNAQAFRKKRDERNTAKPVELPSGAVVSLRRPSVDKLIRSGHIPADVAVSVQRMQGSNTDNMKGDDLTNYFKVVDLMTLNSVVSPKVKEGDLSDEEYSAGYISLDDLEEGDKVFIMSYVQTGLTDLSKFRPEQ